MERRAPIQTFLITKLGASNDQVNLLLSEIEFLLDEDEIIDCDKARDLILTFSSWPKYVNINDGYFEQIKDKMLPDRLVDRFLELAADLNEDYVYDVIARVLRKTYPNDAKLTDEERYLLMKISDGKSRSYLQEIYLLTKEFIAKNGRYPTDILSEKYQRSHFHPERQLLNDLNIIRKHYRATAEIEFMELLPNWTEENKYR